MPTPPEIFIPSDEQAAKADEAIARLPEAVRGFYVAHYQQIPATGQFVGLVCRTCHRWLDSWHTDDCPVRELVPRSEYPEPLRSYLR